MRSILEALKTSPTQRRFARPSAKEAPPHPYEEVGSLRARGVGVQRRIGREALAGNENGRYVAYAYAPTLRTPRALRTRVETTGVMMKLGRSPDPPQQECGAIHITFDSSVATAGNFDACATVARSTPAWSRAASASRAARTTSWFRDGERDQSPPTPSERGMGESGPVGSQQYGPVRRRDS